MKKIYNIALFSNVPASTVTSENFFFDWSQIEDVPYKITFTFQSGGGVAVDDAIITVFCDLGQGGTNFIAQSQTAPINYRSGLLGSLMVKSIGVGYLWYAFLNTNPPTLINHRPPSNNFTVHLHNNSPNFNTNSLSPGEYTLILNFETLE